jgi:DNA helicase-2/ATP-dependent DNA helicase PcrA
LVADTDAWEDEVDKVTMMTLHGSKGLEFPVVYMVAIEQGKLPHERSREQPEQLEEERRLMFVGVTRAEDALTLSYAKYRDYRGQRQPTIPSQFLMELPRNEMHVVGPGTILGDGHSANWDGIDDEGFEDEVYEEEVYSDDEDLEEDALSFDPASFGDDESTSDEPKKKPNSQQEPSAAQVMGSLKTAASLANEPPVETKEPPPRPDPNAFAHGMRVKHPEYGLGKIIALSGDGDGRTATVNFVTAGEKKFVLSRSVLQTV